MSPPPSPSLATRLYLFGSQTSVQIFSVIPFVYMAAAVVKVVQYCFILVYTQYLFSVNAKSFQAKSLKIHGLK